MLFSIATNDNTMVLFDVFYKCLYISIARTNMIGYVQYSYMLSHSIIVNWTHLNSLKLPPLLVFSTSTALI